MSISVGHRLVALSNQAAGKLPAIEVGLLRRTSKYPYCCAKPPDFLVPMVMSAPPSHVVGLPPPLLSGRPASSAGRGWVVIDSTLPATENGLYGAIAASRGSTIQPVSS